MNLFRWITTFMVIYVGDNLSEVYKMSKEINKHQQPSAPRKPEDNVGANSNPAAAMHPATPIYEDVEFSFPGSESVTSKPIIMAESLPALDGERKSDKDTGGDESKEDCGDKSEYGVGREISDNAELVKNSDKNVLCVETKGDKLESVKEPDCGVKRGPLHPIFLNSKYFADSSGKYTRDGGRRVCEDNGLVLAELSSVQDHRSLQDFINHRAFQLSKYQYFIGVNDLLVEGVYTRADGKNMIFQNYHNSQPDNHMDKEDCTTLGKKSYEGAVGMSDEDCSKMFYVLCMYREESFCMNKTLERKFYIRELPKRGLESLHTRTTREYFVSNFQLPWGLALKYCKNQGMVLFDVRDSVTIEFFGSLLAWENSFMSGPIPSVQYWTLGEFQGTPKCLDVFWYDQPWRTEDTEYIPGRNKTFNGIFRLNDKINEDSRRLSGFRRDLCLSFSFESKPDVTPYLKNTNCGIPTYFICAKNTEKSPSGLSSNNI